VVWIIFLLTNGKVRTRSFIAPPVPPRTPRVLFFISPKGVLSPPDNTYIIAIVLLSYCPIVLSAYVRVLSIVLCIDF
jgi:hypothetical protein